MPIQRSASLVLFPQHCAHSTFGDENILFIESAPLAEAYSVYIDHLKQKYEPPATPAARESFRSSSSGERNASAARTIRG
jgi:hypothetical protein